MANIRFERVVLDNEYADPESLLVYRNDRLRLIVSRLGEQHGEEAGYWYVETDLGAPVTLNSLPFFELDDLARQLDAD